MGRGLTLPSSPTTITVSACAVRVTACWGSVIALLAWACSSRTRTYRPGSKMPVGLGTSARNVIWPVVASTVRSENSSRPGWAYSVPSSSTTRTLAASIPLACLNNPLASAARNFITSAADWVKLTYMGLICCTTANWVASPWPTSAPSVTSARPIRPEIGAVTAAYPKLMLAVCTLALATATSASACFCAATALAYSCLLTALASTRGL